MKVREINKELEKIYKERRSWNGAKGPFTPKAIRRREVILIMQYILYQIEDAKLIKDERKERFFTRIFKLIKSFLKSEREINEQSG